MAQQKQIFDGRIRIWSDNCEFVAEYKKYNEHIDDELVCRYFWVPLWCFFIFGYFW